MWGLECLDPTFLAGWSFLRPYHVKRRAIDFRRSPSKGHLLKRLGILGAEDSGCH